MYTRLVKHFSVLEDPRCAGKVLHRLIDILVIAVCAVVAGAESWEDIELYGKEKKDWLATFLGLQNGIPSHDTFRRLFMIINPDAIEHCFLEWVASFSSVEQREVVAIDGKTLRRSFDASKEQKPFHLLSAFSTRRGIAIGQRKVDGKSNEITAIPELLDSLNLKGSIITLDAMGCQRAIAEKIIAQERITSWHSKVIKNECTKRCKAIVPNAAFVWEVHFVQQWIILMRVMVGWCVVVLLYVQMPAIYRHCNSGMGYGKYWQSRPSVMWLTKIRHCAIFAISSRVVMIP